MSSMLMLSLSVNPYPVPTGKSKNNKLANFDHEWGFSYKSTLSYTNIFGPLLILNIPISK